MKNTMNHTIEEARNSAMEYAVSRFAERGLNVKSANIYKSHQNDKGYWTFMIDSEEGGGAKTISVFGYFGDFSHFYI